MLLPKEIGDLTVKQFQGLTLIYQSDKDLEDKGIEMASLISEKSIKYLETEIPLKSLKEIYNHLIYLISDQSIAEFEKQTKFKPIIVVGKTAFRACMASDFSKAQFKALQYIDAKNLSNDWIKNLHLLLCAVWLPVNKLGITQKYDGSKIDEYGKIMLNAKLKDVCGLLFFYSAVLEKLSPIIQTSLEESLKVIQEIMTEMQNDSEVSQSFGVGGT